MAIYRTYACPACKGEFEVLHMSRDEPAPNTCDLCNVSFLKRKKKPAQTIGKVSIGGSNLAKSVAATYRSLEQSTGETNLKDNLRVGDAAGRPMPDNIVSRTARDSGHNFWGGGGAIDIATARRDAKAGAANGNGGIAIEAIQKKRLGFK
jgi:hypothetical protein